MFQHRVARTKWLCRFSTGFHPELTGRENIASSPQTDFDAFCGEEDLNGAILGMKKAYIDGKFKEPSGFHETVAFAEIEKFMDTPVVGAGRRASPSPAACTSA